MKLTLHLSYIGDGDMFHDLPRIVKPNGAWYDVGDVMALAIILLTSCLCCICCHMSVRSGS